MDEDVKIEDQNINKKPYYVFFFLKLMSSEQMIYYFTKTYNCILDSSTFFI